MSEVPRESHINPESWPLSHEEYQKRCIQLYGLCLDKTNGQDFTDCDDIDWKSSVLLEPPDDCELVANDGDAGRWSKIGIYIQPSELKTPVGAESVLRVQFNQYIGEASIEDEPFMELVNECELIYIRHTDTYFLQSSLYMMDANPQTKAEGHLKIYQNILLKEKAQLNNLIEIISSAETA
jgi:hypothetical protein